MAALALAAAAIGGWVRARSVLAAQREAIHDEWPNLTGALERRAELVGNLAQTVQRFTGAANPAFAEIAAARAELSRGVNAQQEMHANSRLMQACARLYLLAERYPELESNRDYQRIGEEIKEGENAVAIERRKYNEELEHYNAQLQRFPDNIVAHVSGFARIDDYVITEQEVQ